MKDTNVIKDSSTIKDSNMLKLYFVIVSFAGIIWTVVWCWNLWYAAINKWLITDEEYIVWSYDSYELSNCENYNNSWWPATKPIDWSYQKRTPEEIETCKIKARESILNKRGFNYKETIIWGTVWWTIFLILFLTHFPVFLRKYRDKNEYTE
jgi:hypothetical protein